MDLQALFVGGFDETPAPAARNELGDPGGGASIDVGVVSLSSGGFG